MKCIVCNRDMIFKDHTYSCSVMVNEPTNPIYLVPHYSYYNYNYGLERCIIDMIELRNIKDLRGNKYCRIWDKSELILEINSHLDFGKLVLLDYISLKNKLKTFIVFS